MASLFVLLFVLPLLAAALVLVLGNRRAGLVRQATLLAIVACGAILWEIGQVAYRTAAIGRPAAHPELSVTYPWMSFRTSGDEAGGGLQFEFGIDGLSLSLLVLTVVLGFVAVIASWKSITERVAEFHALLLLLISALLGAFTAFDLILFYVFFEITLIPLFFIIGTWGGRKREAAAKKFLFYTLFGSFLTLVGIVGLVVAVHVKTGEPLTFSIPKLASLIQSQMAIVEAGGNPGLGDFWHQVQGWVFLAFFIGFAIKTPIVPFHTCLPLTYSEAPTVGTMMLAGVVSKLGVYGFLRLCLPLLPYACWNYGLTLVALLGAAGIIYGALAALAQTDLKRMIAYSSISHLGFIVLGMFALNTEGISGAAIQMLNHGLITGALFLMAGMFADRYRTYEMGGVGGVAKRLPVFAFFMTFFCLASMGLPGLNGFVGEVLALAGMFEANPILAGVGGLGIILGAWYLLAMLQQVFFSPVREPGSRTMLPSDLRPLELWSILPLAILSLVIGLAPKPILSRMESDAAAVAKLYQNPASLEKPGVIQVANKEAN